MKLTFEQIMESITDAEMMTQYEGMSLNDVGKERPELDNKVLSEEEQKFNLAFWAKASMSHVGWESFGEENNKAFKEAVENLYNQISGERRQKDFMLEVATQTKDYVLDRHYMLSTGREGASGGGKLEKSDVGSNFAFNKQKPDNYVLVGEGSHKSSEGEEYLLWQIGTIKQGEEDIMVVSIPNLGERNDYEYWKDFINTFDKLYLENQDKWEKGRIILDVRGNQGGEDKPIDHMAKRLYGNMVNTYKRCEINDTEISNKFLHDHGAYKPQNYEKDGLKKEDLVDRKHFSNQNQILFDETGVYYPFNEKEGYKGRIDVLLDRDVGSSAESAYTSFYHHPNVRYVGENTAGKQQFTQGSFAMPCGYLMRVGVTKLTYWDKEGENIEVVGHKPDIKCRGEDALSRALSGDRDEGRVLGKRELNEPVKGKEVYVEYDPKDNVDPRKAYFAKYLEQGLSKIEDQNIRKEATKEYFSSVRLKLDKKDNKSQTSMLKVDNSQKNLNYLINARAKTK